MKKIICVVALLGFINHSFAQNTFPTSGNVGIGTTSPSTNLEVSSTTEQLRLSYNTTNNLRFVVNASGNASITPSGGSLFLGSGATITTAGAFYGTNFYNYLSSSNAGIGLSTTGTTISRNVADGNPTLIVNNANAANAGNVQVWQFNNASVASMTNTGTLFGAGLYNITNGNNAFIQTANIGTIISRNIADANSALIINQGNASSTGRVVDFQFGGSSVGSISGVGNLALSGGVSATDLRNITSSSNAIIQATTAGTLISRNVADVNPALTVTQANAGSTGDILRIKNSIGTQMAINKDGNVGVGTANPNGKLDVLNNFASGTGGSALIVSANGSGSSSGTTIYGAQVNASTAPGTGSTQTVYGVDINATAQGTGPSPLTAVNAKTVLSRLVGSTVTAYYGGKFLVTGATGTSTASNVSNYGLYGEVANTNATGEVSNSYGVYGKAATGASATAYGGYFTATGGTNNYGVYSAAGTNYFNDNVIIGTATVPTGHKLAVNGSVIATAVTVKLYGAWPDYVFKKDYKLPTLTEVKAYIDKNQHLSDMPSEKEVADNGLNLGEMNKVLTRKVEELTLYLIEQNKRIDKLEKRLKKHSKKG